MTAKGLLTRLTFSLVLTAGMAPWTVGQTRHVGPRPPGRRIWTPYGLNIYYYPGPIAPYAPGFFPPDGWYNWYNPPLFSPPRYDPLLPGSVPAPWQVPAPDWYYGPYFYPPPFYGGYYYPQNTYQWYRGYFYLRPWTRPGWHRDLGPRAGRANPQAPTEVPRNR